MANKITWDGKYLHFGPNWFSSLPELDEDCVLVFESKDDEVRVYKDEQGIYGDFNSYDKHFKDEQELVDYLNENKFCYIGVDDRE
jgi:hypothetical protein